MKPARRGFLRHFRLRLRRVKCKDDKHHPATAHWRDKGSRFVTEVTICKSCYSVLEIVGRKYR